MQTIAYTRPHVTDYGTLVEMTAHPDANLVGSVGKVFLMAAMSLPISGGGKIAGATGASTPTDVVNGLHSGQPAHVLAGTGSGGGGTAPGAGGSAGGGGGGRLPFTGFPALLLAALGAGLSMTGAMVRSKLRRQG